MERSKLLQSKILDVAALQPKLHQWRFKQQRIVFTNGCFDLVHPGHIHLLAEAHDLGDVLIIGLNSDVSVGELKGPTRPVMDQYARSLLLASFSFVDAVVLFDAPTPIDLITAIRPDVLVKGGDYHPDTIVGAQEVQQWGGKVVVQPLIPGYSTSLIEKKIKGNQ